MDLGDLQNYRTGEKAEEAAKAAQENSRKIQRLQDSISQQQATHEREKAMASGLYELSVELDKDFKILSDEPTEEAAERIAEKYLRNPIDEFLDHNNYPALDYKELANKTKEKFAQLTENTWFKWAATKIYPQLDKEARAAKKQREERQAARLIEEENEKKKKANVVFTTYMILASGCVIAAIISYSSVSNDRMASDSDADFFGLICPLFFFGLTAFFIWLGFRGKRGENSPSPFDMDLLDRL
jgi:hypothetical protein